MQLKRKIIEESLRLFSSHGYEGTSLNHILKAAGTSKGGFYNHFKSKEELLHIVLEEARATWQERNLAGIEEIPLQLDKLRKLLRNYLENYLGDENLLPGGCVFITLAVEMDGELGDTMPELAKELHGGFAKVRGIVRRMLVDGQRAGEVRPEIDCEAAADLIFTGMLGTSIIHGMAKYGPQSSQAIESLIGYLDELGPAGPDVASRAAAIQI